MLSSGLVWLSCCGAAFSAVNEPALSAVDDVQNDRTAALLRCTRLVDEVLNVVAQHHVSGLSRAELEQSFRELLRRTVPEIPVVPDANAQNLARLQFRYLPRNFNELGLSDALAAWWRVKSGEDNVELQLDAALSGWLQSLPGGGALSTAAEHRVAGQFARNQYVGIGIQLGPGDNSYEIAKVHSRGPAERAGLKAGDQILAIDGWSTSKQPMAEVLARIRGEPGTSMVLRIEAQDRRVRDVVVTRDFIPLESIHPLGPNDNWSADTRQRIGGVQITRFTTSTVSELREWERRITKAALQAVVLDLSSVMHDQDVPALLQIADALIDGHNLWDEVGRGGTASKGADRECLFRGLPLAVIVGDGAPASAWVLANALRLRRGVAVIHAQYWRYAIDLNGTPQLLPQQSQAIPPLLLTDAIPVDGGRKIIHCATREIQFGTADEIGPKLVWKALVAARDPSATAGSRKVSERRTNEPLDAEVVRQAAQRAAAIERLQRELNPDAAADIHNALSLACRWLMQQLESRDAAQ